MKKITSDDLRRQVRKGLKAGEFHLAFQGIYGVSTGNLASAEALIRWKHPEYGMLLPGAFIETLSDPRIAHDMTRFVVESACRQLGQWQREGRTVFPIAINVPPSVMVGKGFVDSLQRIAHLHGVSPSMLQLEISEAEDGLRILSTRGFTEELRNIGARIAIDDFGTGYSSLAMLSNMEVDVVKLAKEMLESVPACPRACAVVSAVLTLLDKLDVSVVVEGVETAAQADWLAQWPNLLIQGFYYARPTFGLSSVPGSLKTPVRHLRLVSGWN